MKIGKCLSSIFSKEENDFYYKKRKNEFIKSLSESHITINNNNKNKKNLKINLPKIVSYQRNNILLLNNVLNSKTIGNNKEYSNNFISKRPFEDKKFKHKKLIKKNKSSLNIYNICLNREIPTIHNIRYYNLSNLNNYKTNIDKNNIYTNYLENYNKNIYKIYNKNKTNHLKEYNILLSFNRNLEFNNDKLKKLYVNKSLNTLSPMNEDEEKSKIKKNIKKLIFHNVFFKWKKNYFSFDEKYKIINEYLKYLKLSIKDDIKFIFKYLKKNPSLNEIKDIKNIYKRNKSSIMPIKDKNTFDIKNNDKNYFDIFFDKVNNDIQKIKMKYINNSNLNKINKIEEVEENESYINDFNTIGHKENDYFNNLIKSKGNKIRIRLNNIKNDNNNIIDKNFKEEENKRYFKTSYQYFINDNKKEKSDMDINDGYLSMENFFNSISLIENDSYNEFKKNSFFENNNNKIIKRMKNINNNYQIINLIINNKNKKNNNYNTLNIPIKNDSVNNYEKLRDNLNEKNNLKIMVNKEERKIKNNESNNISENQNNSGLNISLDKIELFENRIKTKDNIEIKNRQTMELKRDGINNNINYYKKRKSVDYIYIKDDSFFNDINDNNNSNNIKYKKRHSFCIIYSNKYEKIFNKNNIKEKKNNLIKKDKKQNNFKSKNKKEENKFKNKKEFIEIKNNFDEIEDSYIIENIGIQNNSKKKIYQFNKELNFLDKIPKKSKKELQKEERIKKEHKKAVLNYLIQNHINNLVKVKKRKNILSRKKIKKFTFKYVIKEKKQSKRAKTHIFNSEKYISKLLIKLLINDNCYTFKKNKKQKLYKDLKSLIPEEEKNNINIIEDINNKENFYKNENINKRINTSKNESIKNISMKSTVSLKKIEGEMSKDEESYSSYISIKSNRFKRKSKFSRKGAINKFIKNKEKNNILMNEEDKKEVKDNTIMDKLYNFFDKIQKVKNSNNKDEVDEFINEELEKKGINERRKRFLRLTSFFDDINFLRNKENQLRQKIKFLSPLCFSSPSILKQN